MLQRSSEPFLRKPTYRNTPAVVKEYVCHEASVDSRTSPDAQRFLMGQWPSTVLKGVDKRMPCASKRGEDANTSGCISIIQDVVFEAEICLQFDCLLLLVWCTLTEKGVPVGFPERLHVAPLRLDCTLKWTFPLLGWTP